jgi:hypothetical protein
LSPAGHRRVDELLDQLAEAGADREWLVRFAKSRQAEADEGHADSAADAALGRMLSRQEMDALYSGFATIRDREPLDDVANWANAVLMLLEDAAGDARR